MHRVPTERVTVRLNKQHLDTIDALIRIGELRNRTHAISEAVRDWVRTKTVSVDQVRESQRKQLEVQKLAAQLSELQESISRLQKK